MSDPLELLLADGVIDEVLGRLKSGKEANVSLVRRGGGGVPAKVYKDRATRSFKSNADYKEGRKVRNTRTQRSIDRGGSFGRDAAEEAWKSAEADALYKLAGGGVRVPTPVMFYEGVLLMELVRDAEGRPAPRLIDVALDRDAALRVYADLVAQIISMLCCDLIHGDLSPYNILAAADGPTIIDLPQVISAVHNSRAEHFFLRDFDNVVRFVAGFDPSLAVHTADGRAIWRAYVNRDLTPQFVPPPPPPPRPTRGPDRRGPRPEPRPPHPRGDARGPQRPDARGPQPRFDDRGRGPAPARPDDRNRAPQPRPDDRNRGPAPPRPDNRGPQPRPDDRNRGPQPRFDDRNRGPASARPDDRNRGPAPARPDDRNRAPQRPDARPAAAAPRPPSRRPPPAAAPGPARGHRRRPKRHW